jgi:hypothetical protein
MAIELRNKIFDFEKMSLFTDSPEPNKRARMQFGGRDGNPRVTVFTGVDGKSGIIQGPMDVNTFTAFLSMLESAARDPHESKYHIDLKTSVYEQDKRTNQTRVVSKLGFGKDDKGMVWIILAAESFPKIKFEFMNGIYSDIYQNGIKLSDADISARIALKYLELLKDMFVIYNVETAMQPKLNATGSTSTNNTGTYEKMDDITF